jgi:hypothetical protein
MACEIHDPVFDNSLDLEVAASKGIVPPAIVFFPDRVEASYGTPAHVDVYAMKVDNVGMAQIPIHYDASKLSVTSVTAGSLFTDDNPPFFVTDNDPQNGILTIYITFLGTSGKSVGGTGDIAKIEFNTKASGEAPINISQETIILDPQENPLSLKAYGKGIIDVE